MPGYWIVFSGDDGDTGYCRWVCDAHFQFDAAAVVNKAQRDIFPDSMRDLTNENESPTRADASA
jgi:hypothetical protein